MVEYVRPSLAHPFESITALPFATFILTLMLKCSKKKLYELLKWWLIQPFSKSRIHLPCVLSTRKRFAIPTNQPPFPPIQFPKEPRWGSERTSEERRAGVSRPHFTFILCAFHCNRTPTYLPRYVCVCVFLRRPGSCFKLTIE